MVPPVVTSTSATALIVLAAADYRVWPPGRVLEGLGSDGATTSHQRRVDPWRDGVKRGERTAGQQDRPAGAVRLAQLRQRAVAHLAQLGLRAARAVMTDNAKVYGSHRFQHFWRT